MATTTAEPVYDVLTVYRTEEGREALVLFEGREEGPLSPLRFGGDGAVRIGYLAADGAAEDMRGTEYAWYAGTLTPAYRLDGFATDDEDPAPVAEASATGGPEPVRCPTATHAADGTPHTIIGCGSVNVSEPDFEGLIDCFDCGIFFNPADEK